MSTAYALALAAPLQAEIHSGVTLGWPGWAALAALAAGLVAVAVLVARDRARRSALPSARQHEPASRLAA